MAISLAFGLQSLRYPIGALSRAGPGLFPFMVSCLLNLNRLSPRLCARIRLSDTKRPAIWRLI